ncbi:MAG: O-methyltransferase [bacterium]|nr:O-methyltransferase [bacterium]
MKTYPDLDTYRKELFAPEDDLLKEIMPDAVEQGLPRISVSPESGKMLYFLAKSIGARKILEFGALAGYSGIWLARALPDTGRFITLEIHPKHAEVTRKNYEAAGLSGIAEVRVGDAHTLVTGAAAEAPFDLVFIDADKESYPDYLDFALEHTRQGGLIVADNTNGFGHVHEALDESDGRRAIRVYNDRVANHSGLVSNIIPIGGWLTVSLVL